MKLDSMLPFFNVKDTPVDGSSAQRASHWKQTNDGVIHDANGSMRAVPNTVGSGVELSSSIENIKTLKAGLESVKSEIVALFSQFQSSESAAQDMADKFIEGVVGKASHSAYFEVSLSYSMSQFSAQDANKQAWTDIKGLNITVDNVSGEMALDFSQVEVELGTQTHVVAKDISLNNGKVKETEQESKAVNPLDKMNESSLREFHAFLLTTNNVDGSELGQAIDRARLQGRMPDSSDREKYIDQWRELQKDPGFRHDITYDDRDSLQGKVEALLSEYRVAHPTAELGPKNEDLDESDIHVYAGSDSPVLSDLLEAGQKSLQSILQNLLDNDVVSAVNSIKKDGEKTSLNVDFSVYLGAMKMSQNNQLVIGLEQNKQLVFKLNSPGVNLSV